MAAPFSKHWFFFLLKILEQFHHNVLSQIVEKHCSEMFSILSVLIMSAGLLRFNSSHLTSVMILLTSKWQQQEINKLTKTRVSFR